MYFVYIIYSDSKDQYYKGFTEAGPSIRLKRHNEGWTRSTKAGVPWELVYYRSFEIKKEALRWERYLKAQRNRDFMERLIASEDNELNR